MSDGWETASGVVAGSGGVGDATGADGLGCRGCLHFVSRGGQLPGGVRSDVECCGAGAGVYGPLVRVPVDRGDLDHGERILGIGRGVVMFDDGGLLLSDGQARGGSDCLRNGHAAVLKSVHGLFSFRDGEPGDALGDCGVLLGLLAEERCAPVDVHCRADRGKSAGFYSVAGPGIGGGVLAGQLA